MASIARTSLHQVSKRLYPAGFASLSFLNSLPKHKNNFLRTPLPRLARPAISSNREYSHSHSHSHSYTTSTPSRMANLTASTFLEYVKNRRTYYPLSKDISLSADQVDDIVKVAMQHVPSSYNSQSNRVVVLQGAHHEKLWDMISEVLRAVVPEEQWKSTAERMAWFKGAAGTILFFIDQDVVRGMQDRFPLYAEGFPGWAGQSAGMLQFALWTALEAEGLGANLQHYNPLADENIAAEWNVPRTWQLNAQLVFGGRTGETYPKESKPAEETVKSFRD
ncbi:Nitroreductase [Sodiomyces alkalinus F11]|uniref:Nitroreductase n=1 Tax=Sodiomyces alkalinus (strain CBS 110278 / VKM F-3762 / F11) TaxID=1314773 RepID=A0A3N2PLZ9_SODAK|nr:Nitroreductase [Sodiomyces alkalinus F11]ROT35538.1 Nitroreductase [Sodiomyces alkalinus F11]